MHQQVPGGPLLGRVSVAGLHVAGLPGLSPLAQEYFSVLTLVGSYERIFVSNLYFLVSRVIQQVP